jgi:GxxExxY protein
VKDDELTERIIGAAIAVHRDLGPGLLESTYEACLTHLLVQHNFIVERQKSVPVVFRGMLIDCAYRIDLMVERRVIVEVKSVERLEPVFQAQLLTYMKLSGCKLGLLMNFNVPLLKDGLRRFIL